MDRVPRPPSRGQTLRRPLIIRLRLRCRGAVQGVGFRPTVHRLATAAGLTGVVSNDPEGATIEIEGDEEPVRLFVRDLPSELPPLARLDGLDVEEIEPEESTDFEIIASKSGSAAGAAVPPDSALCPACRRELLDPSDRRHGHPFITCTDCGPRYSLVLSLPYDRPQTSMGCFALCPRCEAEYTDPSDRRFHAEPICCPECGPRLRLLDAAGTEVADGGEAVARAADAIENGAVVAIKGLGGFQLACRADDPDTVARLRRRKRRPSKPFALMVRDIDAARRLVDLSSADEALMTSPQCPIVLTPRTDDSDVDPDVAPGMEDLGVVLPTTPLHVLLFQRLGPRPLIMTSGNASDEPIAKGNREALERLRGIADFFLVHDRDVVRRVDDSVARSSGDGPFLVRRARGWVPDPLPLPEPAPEPLLALGAHLQVTAGVARDDQFVLTPHIGDLDTEEARGFLREAVDHLEDLLQVRAHTLVADAHPDYPSRWLAEELAEKRNGTLIVVQHHLAHAAAVLAEHRRFPSPGETALVLALDGTGWGPTRSAWGGEWLLVHGDLRWKRAGQLEPMILVGGEAAVREPWRIAAASLTNAGDHDLLIRTPIAETIGIERLERISELSGNDSWPRATGAGRLFEACGALLGLAPVNRYEGEAAIRLEAAAAGVASPEPWRDIDAADDSTILPSNALLAAAARRAAAGIPIPEIVAGFHSTFNDLAGRVTRAVIERHGTPETLAAAGGCLVNRRLRSGLGPAIGAPLLLPFALPPGDGGLAYGQAVLAALCRAGGCSPERLVYGGRVRRSR